MQEHSQDVWRRRQWLLLTSQIPSCAVETTPWTCLHTVVCWEGESWRLYKPNSSQNSGMVWTACQPIHRAGPTHAANEHGDQWAVGVNNPQNIILENTWCNSFKLLLYPYKDPLSPSLTQHIPVSTGICAPWNAILRFQIITCVFLLHRLSEPLWMTWCSVNISFYS